MDGFGDVRRRQPPHAHLISGHPQLGRRAVSAREAGVSLGVTSTTVRAWIDEGKLAGYCVPAGRVFRYFAYEDAVQTVHDSRRSAVGSVRSRLQRVEHQVASLSGGVNSRIGMLEHVVLSQSAAMDELRDAFRHEQEANDLLVQAVAAQRRAAVSYSRAERLAAEVGAALGVPDFAPAGTSDGGVR